MPRLQSSSPDLGHLIRLCKQAIPVVIQPNKINNHNILLLLSNCWYDWELSLCLPWTHNSLRTIHGTFSMAGIWWQNFTTWAKILPADGWNYSELNVIHEKRLQLFSSPDESGRCIGIRANLHERKECYRNNKLISYLFTESTREQKRWDY